jgi:CheY-like chemotaxis protein
MPDEKPNVLLVDDNEATCTLVTALLHRDFSVDIAGDGLEALEKLKTNNYSVVLLDLRMPNMDGYEVLELLHTARRDSLRRVIVLTASIAHKEIVKVKAYDIWGVVTKPFEIDVLIAAVKACAGGGGTPLGTFLSTGVLLLLADLLRQKFL